MDRHCPSPEPGSPEERADFAQLQEGLAEMFRRVFPDPRAPRCVVIVPSHSLDQDVLARVSGARHYEERMLCMLMLLRLPRTRIVLVTSSPISEEIIDYYVHLLPGVPASHARRRLTLLSCWDTTPRPLSAKILERPRLLARIREAVGDPAAAHLSCYNVSALERTLAVRLGIPLYGCDPALLPLASKSGARRLFRAQGVAMPEGFEDLADAQDVAAGLAALKARLPGLRRAVIKLNDGFSGEGNAIFSFAGAPERGPLDGWIRECLPALTFCAAGMGWEVYSAKIASMGAIVEEFVEGSEKRSPSVQYRVDPLGRLETISTHDQVLGGPDSQIFLGCRFPADPAYRRAICEQGIDAARAVRDAGVIGRFGIDFIAARQPEGWRSLAIEINLRKGGTTHPFMMLQYLTEGSGDPDSGAFRTPTGIPCCYFATDNLESPAYRGLTPADLIDIAVLDGLHFNSATQQGVVFHLIGALSEFGKFGILCVAADREGADRLYRDTVAVLDREQGAPDRPIQG